MSFEDQNLNCADCGGTFVFTVGEQEFYAEKGLNHAPKRCPDCRKSRKKRYSGGHGGGGGRGGGGGYSRGGRY